MAEVVGSKTFLFGYTHFGGTNNLLPGRPETQKVQMGMPKGATAFVAIGGINYAFINGNLSEPSNNMRDQPLGQLRANLSVSGDTLTCEMRLTAETEDNPCMVHVRANVLFFK
jgi:hypothetical protein